MFCLKASENKRAAAALTEMQAEKTTVPVP
jgi:hypothetical protein